MELDVRPAVSSDAIEACALLRRAITQCCVKDHHNNEVVLSAWLANKTPETVASWFAFPGNLPFVAVADGHILGIALLTRLGKLSLFYVDPAHRKMGIGKKLLTHIESHVEELGIESVQIDSTISATAFYLRHGFMYAGTKKTKFGLTSIALRKYLDTSEKPSHSTRICSCSVPQPLENEIGMGLTSL